MRKLAIFSAAFTAAAALFAYLVPNTRVLWLAGVCIVLSVFGRALGLRRCCAAALGAAFGFLWCVTWGVYRVAPLNQVAGTEQTITVTLCADPVESDYGAYALCEMKLNGRSYHLRLYADDGLLEADAGDRVTCTAALERTGMELRNGESLYLRAQGIPLIAFAESALTCTPGEAPWTVRLQQWFQTRIDHLYTPEVRGLLRALLTGDRSQMDYGTRNDLSVTGLSHAVAVSGMHVSILMTLIGYLCGKNPRLTALLGFPLVVVFVLMTGASPSACRAAVMQLFLLGASLVRRERDGLTALGAAALLLLLENPWTVADLSFQLSFTAVLGLLLLAAPIQNRILRLREKPGPILRFLASGLSATLAASALTLPLTVLYFGTISLIAPVSNLLVLWAVTGVFSLGLLSCLLGPAGIVLAWPAGLLGRFVLWGASVLSRLPYASVDLQHPALFLWAWMAYGLAYFWLLTPKRRSMVWPMCVLTAAFLAAVGFSRWTVTRGPWSFTALDVGQGQCLILEQNGFTTVIDCGGSDPEDAGEQAARYLLGAGIRQVDLLILTHYDADHAGGVEQLTRRLRVDHALIPDTGDSESVCALLNAAAVETVLISQRTKLEFSGGTMEILPPLSGKSGNNGGLCVLATAEEYDMLITGDLDRFAEMRLLSSWKLPRVELLVAGHHGAADSTSQPLLDAIRPETAVISVGADNPYGHPASTTLERLDAAGAQIFRTDRDGMVVLYGEETRR